MLYVELLVQGLVQGCIYALIAIGLSLVYGLLRILHIAHAAMFTIGGYFGLLITNATGSLLLGVTVSMVLVGVLGMLLYRVFYQPILHEPPYVSLIASIGLLIALEEIYRIIFGPLTISFANPPLQQTVSLLGVRLKEVEVITMAGTVLLIGALAIFANRSRLGVAWRATVSDSAMAESFGVSLLKVRYVNFFIASTLAALAGVIVALLGNMVDPTMGAVPAYKALAIVVLGGLGNVRGTLIAALLLGIVESFGTIYLGSVLDRDSIAFAVLILVLMVRPQGIFGKA